MKEGRVTEIQAAIQTIADVYGITAGDVQIVFDAISRGERSRAKWISLCKIANAGHSHRVEVSFKRGCIVDTETTTTLEALEQTLEAGQGARCE